ncbi:hypothetical protein C1646_732121 [Rhizophagus diaphanus]|nr:hypothetical protein C1646_732121 [Rhizophagus diaphanus] [Rhizophagus sp. MUCL 43196]
MGTIIIKVIIWLPSRTRFITVFAMKRFVTLSLDRLKFNSNIFLLFNFKFSSSYTVKEIVFFLYIIKMYKPIIIFFFFYHMNKILWNLIIFFNQIF